MEFDGDIGKWQRRAGESPEGNARRFAVLDALAIRPGEHVLEVGCGGGHLLRDCAVAVGQDGGVVGIDVSSEQLQAAAAYCQPLKNVKLLQSSATELPFKDAEFDSVASIQTLEYITDIDRAVGELRRVVKRGGRAAFVSMLWDHWRFYGPDPALNDRIHQAWVPHCPHQMLPFELPKLLRAAGYSGVVQSPLSFMTSAFHEKTYAYWIAKTLTAFVVGQGVDKEEADVWFAQLMRANEDRRFGFVAMPVLTIATAA